MRAPSLKLAISRAPQECLCGSAHEEVVPTWGRNPGCPGAAGRLAEALGVLEHADACIDLQGRPQLDVHGTHQVVLLEQQQGLPINLLGTELLGDLLAT